MRTELNEIGIVHFTDAFFLDTRSQIDLNAEKEEPQKAAFPIPDVASSLEFFMDKKNAQGRIYKENCRRILGLVEKWCQQHQVNHGFLRGFVSKYFTRAVFTHLDVNERAIDLYRKGIPAFEKIHHLLQHPDIPLLRKQSVMRNLLSQITECAPGANTAIHDAVRELEASLSLQSKYKYWRKFLATQAVLTLLRAYDTPVNLETHYVTEVLLYFADILVIDVVPDVNRTFCSQRIVLELVQKLRDQLRFYLNVDQVIELMMSDYDFDAFAIAYAKAAKVSSESARIELEKLEDSMRLYGREESKEFVSCNTLAYVKVKEGENGEIKYQANPRARDIVRHSFLERLRSSGIVNVEEREFALQDGMTLCIRVGLSFRYAYLYETSNKKVIKLFDQYCLKRLFESADGLDSEIFEWFGSELFEERHRQELLLDLIRLFHRKEKYQQKFSAFIWRLCSDASAAWLMMKNMSEGLAAIFITNFSPMILAEKVVTRTDLAYVLKLLRDKALFNRFMPALLSKTYDTYSLVYLAIYYNEFEVLANFNLVDMKMTLDAIGKERDKAGRSALHWAAKKGAVESLAWLTANKLIDVNVRDNEGATPLYRAAESGSEEAVRVLLAAGADPELERHPRFGYKTPLSIAMCGNRQGIARILKWHILFNKIDPAVETPRNRAIMRLAASQQLPALEFNELIRQFEFIDCYREVNANYHAKTENRRTSIELMNSVVNTAFVEFANATPFDQVKEDLLKRLELVKELVIDDLLVETPGIMRFFGLRRTNCGLISSIDAVIEKSKALIEAPNSR